MVVCNAVVPCTWVNVVLCDRALEEGGGEGEGVHHAWIIRSPADPAANHSDQVVYS
jgi:hypothetical protein